MSTCCRRRQPSVWPAPTIEFRFDANLLFDLYGDVRFLIQNGQAADLTDLIANDTEPARPEPGRAAQQWAPRAANRHRRACALLQSNLVADPAVTLDDLQIAGVMGVPSTLDSTFDRAFWGIGAFGGKLTDKQAISPSTRGHQRLACLAA